MYEDWSVIKAAISVNIGYPSEFQPLLRSRNLEPSFVQKIHFSCHTILNIGTKHGKDKTVLCAEFWNDFITEQLVMGKRDFTRFECKMRFVQIFYVITVPRFLAQG